jgi:DNA polymerase-4
MALGLLRASQPEIRARGLTLVGITLANLSDARTRQLALPFDRRCELDDALDRVRDRYGAAAITRGALVGRDPGLSVPLLPD